MKKKKEHTRSLIIPCATVFISSACIMILEIVAGRLIAKYLGATLYVWTSVIGIVLGGITIGNYIGGRIADRFPAHKALSVLFGISSVTCVLIIVTNNAVGNWKWLWQFPWPLRVFTHVALVFLLPSTLLGTISPVVATIALNQGFPKGKTIGDIYAWSAAGSILGTLLAGFFLISWLGTSVIVWIIGGILLIMGIMYRLKMWFLYAWAGIFGLLLLFGIVNTTWASGAGAFLHLREDVNRDIIYQDESDYCYIAVEQISKEPDIRTFIQDDLTSHSKIDMGNLRNLQFVYTKIFAAITHMLYPADESLSVLSIGGGGYVFPRYIALLYPDSHIDVVEIDPAVTEAAIRAFGLPRETSINTITMDARNYINGLIETKKSGNAIPVYDFIYGDAFGAAFIPHQLTTRECHDTIHAILSEKGVYMVNLPDVYTKGKLLGSFVHTIRQTFPYVYVVSDYKKYFIGRNFVVIGSKREIDMQRLTEQEQLSDVDVWILNNADIEKTIKNNITLSDEYAPVETLVTPFFMLRARASYAGEIMRRADKLKNDGMLQASVAMYEKAIQACPELSIFLYNRIGEMYAEQKKWDSVIEAGKKAIDYNEKADAQISVSDLHYHIGVLLLDRGIYDEGLDHLYRSIGGFKTDLTTNPDSIDTIMKLGNAYAYTGDFENAVLWFTKGVEIDQYDADIRLFLISALVEKHAFDKAEKELTGSIQFFKNHGLDDEVKQLEDYLNIIKNKKKSEKL